MMTLLFLALIPYACEDKKSTEDEMEDEKELSDSTVTDVQGNVYKIVKIGKQWWMAENLKVTTYRNGDDIPFVNTDGVWGSLEDGEYYILNNNPTNVDTFGYLYNWKAATDSRGLCPEGWYIPDHLEWGEMVKWVDKQFKTEQLKFGGIMSENGALKLKSKGVLKNGDGLWGKQDPDGTHWDVTEGNNETGFSALPGARRIHNGEIFEGIGWRAYFWTSTKIEGNEPYAWTWHMGLGPEIYSGFISMRNGMSIRCLKNE